MTAHNILINELAKSVDEDYVLSYSTSIKSQAKKRLFGTLFFNLHELRKNFSKNLDPFVLVGIEQRMSQISDWMAQEAYGHFFGNLYYVERSRYYKNKPKLQKLLNWSIGDLYTAHMMVLSGDNLSDSLGSTFMERLNELISADCKIIDSKDPDFFKLSLINLCTANSLLIDYVNITDASKEQKDLAKKYMELSNLSLKKAFIETEISGESIHLLLYAYLTTCNIAKILNDDVDNLKGKYDDTVSLFEKHVSKLRAYTIILSLCNLYYLNNEKFRVIFDKVFENLSTKVDWINRPFYIKMILLYLLDIELGIEIIPLKIYPNFEIVNVDEVMQKLFPKYFSNNNPPAVNDSDLAILMNYDDSEIRIKLAHIFEQSQYLSENQKRQLVEEASKPHTGSEISDFEVCIGEDYPNIIYACMPIKSGREITTPSVPETYAYQIMKPFIHLHYKCVVIFITAKRCSQALDAYIKKLKAMYQFPIAIIQEAYLCSIFKFYGQL
jgi:hypothetical protein